MSENLKQLCECFAVSSAEDSIAAQVIEKAAACNYEITKDRLGSVIATKKSCNADARTLMIACPMDEVGFMVSEVKDDGTLSFICLESLPAVSLINQPVDVLCQDNSIVKGIITGGCELLDNKCSISSADQLYIRLFADVDKVKASIHPGDLVSFSPNYQQINDYVMSKALFPRCLNATSLALMEQVKDNEYPFHIAFAFISQSVIGYRGTMTATYVTKPDAALALTCFDRNNKNIKDEKAVYVGLFDRQMIPNVGLLDHVKANATVTPIVSFMGNDGSFIHKTLQGTPTLSMGVAVESLGSSCEHLNTQSLTALTHVLEDVLASLDNDIIDKLANGVKK